MKILALAAVFVAALQAQVLRTVPYNLVRLDPALDALIDPASPLEILGEHFGLTEGPVWVKDAAGGYLLFSDCAANVIYKWQPNAPLSVFLERSGFTGELEALWARRGRVHRDRPHRREPHREHELLAAIAEGKCNVALITLAQRAYSGGGRGSFIETPDTPPTPTT